MITELMTSYEKRVAALLEETGHPMRRDVMDDLRSHLEETFGREDAPRTMEELEARMGTPEEYAENLAPATGHRLKPLVRRRRFWMGAGIAIVILALLGVFVANRHALAAHYRAVLDRNFYAPPFFSLEKMRNLPEGASADAIRDAIGFPLQRYQLEGHEGEIYWEYTAYPTRNAPFYTMARLVLDAEDRTLIRPDIKEDIRIGNPPEERNLQRPVSVEAGTISFSRAGGKKIVLKPSDKIVYVIIFGMEVEKGADLTPAAIAQGIERREEFVTRSWEDVQRDQVEFIHIVGPRGEMDWKTLNGLLEALPPDMPVYSAMGMPHVFENRGAPVGSLVYDVVVYDQGTLYHYPDIYAGIPQIEQGYREDQNWLMHKLTEED